MRLEISEISAKLDKKVKRGKRPRSSEGQNTLNTMNGARCDNLGN
jgi:hypothetical protein